MTGTVYRGCSMAGPLLHHRRFKGKWLPSAAANDMPGGDACASPGYLYEKGWT